GTCLDTPPADGSGCTSDSNDCTSDVRASPTRRSADLDEGTTCGSQTSGDCDEANTCNATGTCLDNHHADGSGCTSDSNDCTSDVCAAGSCAHVNVDEGTTCVSQTSGDCDEANTCNATG